MRRARAPSAAMIATGMSFAPTAAAHSGTGLPGGFVAGVLHPVGGPDHLLAMVASLCVGGGMGAAIVYERN